MKVLVTGATGFVGTHLLAHLRSTGATITALIRDPAKKFRLDAAEGRIVVGGFDDLKTLDEACRQQDVVFHVAGAIAARNEEEFLATNRDATARLVAAAERGGVRRFVLVSSQAAGGPSRPDRPTRGDDPPHPVTQYGRSKLAGETVVRDSALQWTIVRPPAVYGPHDREMFRVFQAVSRGLAPVFGDGSQQLSLIYGPDLAAALVAAASTPATIGGVFYAAHPQFVTSRQLVDTIARVADRRPLVLPIPVAVGRLALRVTGAVARWANRVTVLTADKANELFQPAWLCDPGQLNAATGWHAQHDLEAGAKATWDWYRRERWL